MPLDSARFQYSSDQSITVYLGEAIGLETHHRVLKLARRLERQPLAGVVNLYPAYCSVMVVFDPLSQDHATVEAGLRRYLDELDAGPLPPSRMVEIPVCYGGAYGSDLNDVATLHRIPAERVIELHASAEYVVYCLGFVPGFAFLGGLPAEIATPRLAAARKRIPAGSVAIGGEQTGIYPMETPGGWRLIGATPLIMFDRDYPEKSRLRIGDRVRFKPISVEQFVDLQERCPAF